MHTVFNYKNRDAILPQQNTRSSHVDEFSHPAMTISVIEHRSLHGECLARALRALAPDLNVLTFASYEEWQQVHQEVHHTSLLLYCCHGRFVAGGAMVNAISAIKQGARDIPLIVISDVEDPETIIDVIGSGAQGYIPTSASLDVALEAMRLVRVGGTYLPASAILNRHRRAVDSSNAIGATEQASQQSKFTSRQQAVLSALRQGKANKLIAYELDLKESTVKVHMRNIMKKLRATNRTEVVCMLNDDIGPHQ